MTRAEGKRLKRRGGLPCEHVWIDPSEPHMQRLPVLKREMKPYTLYVCRNCGESFKTGDIEMVKAVHRRSDGTVVMVLGLSEGNLERMRMNQPIFFDPAALRIKPGEVISGVMLFYGRTEDEMGRMLKTFIGPNTEVISVPEGDKLPQ